MNQPTLSKDARAALAVVKKLPEAQQATIAGILSLDLANRISGVAENSTSAKRAKLSAGVVEGIAAATTPQKTALVHFRANTKSTISLLSIDSVTRAAEVKQSIRLSKVKKLAMDRTTNRFSASS
jgi:hypothetical protein